MLFLAPVLLFLTAETSASPANDEARSVRTIEIDESRATKVYRVRTALGVPAVVEFPEPFTTPVTCGDCAEEPPESATPEAVAAFEKSPALFALSPVPRQQYLAVKPKQYPVSQGGSIPDEDYLTTLTVRLAKSQLTLTLQLEYSPKAKADARVVFALPNRSAESRYVQATLATERAAQEQAYAKRVQAGVAKALLDAFLQPHRCVPRSDHVRTGDLVLEVSELCRFGTRVLVRFTVENRSQLPTTLGDVQLHAQVAGATRAPLPSAGHVLSQDELAYNTTASGVAAAELPGPTVSASSYSFTVYERGGKSRELTVPNLDF